MYISSEAPFVEDDRCLSTWIWFVHCLTVDYVRVSSTSVSYAYLLHMRYFVWWLHAKYSLITMFARPSLLIMSLAC